MVNFGSLFKPSLPSSKLIIVSYSFHYYYYKHGFDDDELEYSDEDDDDEPVKPTWAVRRPTRTRS